MSTVSSTKIISSKQGNPDPLGVKSSGSTNSGATFTFIGTGGSPTQLCFSSDKSISAVALNSTKDGIVVTLGAGGTLFLIELSQSPVDNNNWTVIISSPTDAGKGVTFQGGTGGGPGQ